MSFLRNFVVISTILSVNAAAALACTPRDFVDLPLPAPERPAAVQALLLAYPDLALSDDGASVVTSAGAAVPLGTIRDIGAAARLTSATLAEQFLQAYPLDFDLDARSAPFFDPGRLRNDAFFRALWFDSEGAARASLTRVTMPGTQSVFQVTQARGVDCQLTAALDLIHRTQPDAARYFAGAGGGFNWRTIAGTRRLSAHSFGISVDINPEIGQYWRWTGAREGAVGAYTNKVPESLVAAMERFGFIWGGKWHHFDGMHFEYRPELILHARLAGPAMPSPGGSQ